jgi:hypothetical protein
VKRIFALLFLIVFLFNVGGYYLVFWTLRLDANQKLAHRLDQNQYNNQDTYLFKLPLTLPYGLNQEGYERVNGSFEHNGEFYKLVKQKHENDTLYIVCIKDHEEQKIANAFSDYVKLSNDLPASSQKDGLSLLSKLSKDFEPNILLDIVMTDGWFLGTFYADHSSSILKGEKIIHSPPPKVIS